MKATNAIPLCSACGKHYGECEHTATKSVGDDRCWFIERDGGEWWTGDGRLPWSRDPLKAVRFCRCQDAGAVICGRDMSLPAWRDCDPFPSDHIFL